MSSSSGSSPKPSGGLFVIFKFPKVSAALQVLRPVNNTLVVLQVLAESLKFLVCAADTLEALQPRANTLKFPAFVTDFLGASINWCVV